MGQREREGVREGERQKGDRGRGRVRDWGKKKREGGEGGERTKGGQREM